MIYQGSGPVLHGNPINIVIFSGGSPDPMPPPSESTHDGQGRKGAKIRNRYNQVPHLAQDTNGKVTNSQLDTTNESQEVSPFPTGDHKALIRACSR